MSGIVMRSTRGRRTAPDAPPPKPAPRPEPPDQENAMEYQVTELKSTAEFDRFYEEWSLTFLGVAR